MLYKITMEKAGYIVDDNDDDYQVNDNHDDGNNSHHD